MCCTRHGYTCEATPGNPHKWSDGVAADVYCVHRAAASLPGCSAMSSCCHEKWQRAFDTSPALVAAQGFALEQSPGVCCMSTESEHADNAKTLWRSNAAGRHTPTSCAQLCRADSGCRHFSHDRMHGECVLCSGCALSAEVTSARRCISWRRLDT